MKTCKTCGSHIEDHSTFCLNCGSSVEVPAPYQQSASEDPTMVDTVNACVKKAKTALSLSIVSLVVLPAFCIISLVFCWCTIIPILNFIYGFFVGFAGTAGLIATIVCLILAFVTRSSIKRLPEVSAEYVSAALYEKYQTALKKSKTSLILNLVILGIVASIVAVIVVLFVIALIFGGISFVITFIVGLFESLVYNSYYYY